MKTRPIAAPLLAHFLLIALCGCVGMENRARAESELRLCEVVPGELSAREDVLRDLRWRQSMFKERPGHDDPFRRNNGLWTGQDVFRIAFAGDPEPANVPPEFYLTNDEKKLMDSCRKRLIEALVEFRFDFQEKAGLLTGCVDYPRAALAWRKEMQDMKLTTDNLRVLKKDIRKDGSYYIILETGRAGLRDYLTKTYSR